MGPNTRKSLVIIRVVLIVSTLAIFAFLFLVFAIPEHPNRKAANASAAVSALRIIYLASTAYATEHPQQGYAKDLSDLANPHPGLAEAREWAVDPVLASGQKPGYKFTYIAQSTKGDGKIDAFQVTADPLVPGKTGNYHFFLDQTGVFRFSKIGAADSSSAVLE